MSASRIDPGAMGVVRVQIGETRYLAEVTANGHALVSDEPASLGGNNEGPTPYALLLAGLGACKVITLRMYADRKNWPLEEAVVTLRHDRRHAEDCERCDDPAALLDHIDVELRLSGAQLTQQQRDRLREVSERCPVHKTLSAGVRIGTKIVNGKTA